MEKRVYAVGVVLLILFSAGCIEDPQAGKARQELAGLKAEHGLFEANFNGVSSLELSPEVYADLDVMVYALDVFASIVPGQELDSDAAHNLLAAIKERDSQDIKSSFDSPSELFEELIKFEEVVDEDLKLLSRRADQYDAAVASLRDEASIPPFPVDRIPDTEKYFIEYELIVSRHEFLMETVKSYSSAKFRERIAGIQKANRAHGRFVRFISRINDIGFINPRLSEIYPNLKEDEQRLMACVSEDKNESHCQGPQAWQYAITPLANNLKKEVETLKDH